MEIGSYLSGGMDSGAVTCVAGKNFRNLKTFTGGFDVSSASGLEAGFDERGKAEFLSNKYKLIGAGVAPVGTALKTFGYIGQATGGAGTDWQLMSIAST